MAATEIKVGSQPVSFPNYPTKERDDNGNWIIVERYWVKGSTVLHTLPDHLATTNQLGATVTDPDGNTLKCRSARIETATAPGIVEVELRYSLTENNITLKGPADNPRSIRLTGEDIPIDDERLLVANGGVFTAAQIAAAKQAGHQSLPLYGMEYTYTQLDASFTWSEANIIASLQSTGSPTGITSPTAGKWELTGKEIDESDDQTIIREHWRYAGAGVLPIKA